MWQQRIAKAKRRCKRRLEAARAYDKNIKYTTIYRKILYGTVERIICIKKLNVDRDGVNHR